jgi:steroid 5-alpha reductase family enzyme
MAAMAADHAGRQVGPASRPAGFLVVAGVYLVAGVAAWLTVLVIGGRHPLAVTFWADLAATVVVFAASAVAGNASLYDPYWSVAPAAIVAAWAWYGPGSVRQALVLILVLIWAVRLTANWASAWRGLGHEDWRYVQIREQIRGRVPWWLVNLTGIQLMPTLVVFAGLLPVRPAVATAGRPFGLLDVAAVAVTAAAVAIETVADRQLHRFTGDPANRGRVMDRGLWRYSRHPNYLGEIGFWWGMWLFGLAAAPSSGWWTAAGPVVMVVLFAAVSVPLMDRRSLQRRPAYAEQMRRVPALVPWPGRHA